MQTITLSIHENHLAKLINFLVSLPKNDVKVLENSLNVMPSFARWTNGENSDELSQSTQDSPSDLLLQKDIDVYNSLDYLSVSEDRTDEDWLNAIMKMSDKASKSIAADLPLDERGWTRDELYER
ncbi:hypothetical protein B0181_02830 [Moraxella caviae]|uniref:Uncharacterized protein n=1 Tax=Moraxella caviae TaxID=34060 RepID=A0A1T0A767_9GAMM|nr:hypothetical protein [Moraxella caviae]OOR91510.1 hypothetical protein B0181_02830 [Moraxella caviae]STZ14405.1 Uncharacterised protein [Moraxella caviae]VEW10508.1 Uncharacterised protein [Moraxella caviae]